MNVTLARTTGLHEHPPPVSYQPRTVGVFDRVALHVGIALIKWGRRPRPTASREQLELRYRAQVERQERERAAERRMLLMRPLR
jgi:hypothetical protein